MRFLSVTKPGIIFGNAITTLGGFLLASNTTGFNPWLLLATLVGLSLVIASGCIFNNCIDRDIDQLMERTQSRVLVQGLISSKIAIIYAIFLGLVGFITLFLETNLLTFCIAALAFFIYVFAYSLWLKRRSTCGIVVGGIAGALPPVIGYTALIGRFDLGAALLFLILFFWQMPHFYAIAIYRLKDFANAQIPTLPLKKGIQHTQKIILIYVVCFAVIALLPYFFGYAGRVYLIVALLLGLIWFFMGIQGIKTQPGKTWSRKMFLFSILTIFLLSLAMGIKY